jgi:deazaflavin-dependent oxidoreductase (nitroreductase family)
MDTTTPYRKPGFFTRKILNPFIVVMMKMGISVWGSRILESRGRTSGLPRRTPVNLLDFEGQQYLVSPRGDSQWVRNVRADAGRLVLILGRRSEGRIAQEVADSEKGPLLRAYLRRWKMEVGIFFDGVSADSPDEDLDRIAAAHPVFRLSGPAN